MSETKPTTIPVREYYRENYILKVARKECTVSVPGYAGSWVEDVEDVHGMYFVKFQDHEGPHSFNFMPDDELTVTWLPQTDSAKPEGLAVGVDVTYTGDGTASLKLGAVGKIVRKDRLDDWWGVSFPGVYDDVTMPSRNLQPLAVYADLATLRSDLAAAREQVSRLRALEADNVRLLDAIDTIYALLQTLPIGGTYTVEQHATVGKAYDLSSLIRRTISRPIAAVLAGDEGGA